MIISVHAIKNKDVQMINLLIVHPSFVHLLHTKERYLKPLFQEPHLDFSDPTIKRNCNRIVCVLKKVIKEDEKRAGRILYTALEAIDSCANLLYPFMPSTSDLVRSAIPRETENLWGLNKIKMYLIPPFQSWGSHKNVPPKINVPPFQQW